jgi:hypothetical protein
MGTPAGLNELTLLIRGIPLLHHPFNDKITNAINITVMDRTKYSPAQLDGAVL